MWVRRGNNVDDPKAGNIWKFSSCDSFGRDLRILRRAWEQYRSSRAREAVYGFLDPLYATAKRWREHSDVWTAEKDCFRELLERVAGSDLDRKTRSKWVAALRFVERMSAKLSAGQTIRKNGGINACARKGRLSE
jgi:hypothetical protein